MSDILQMSGVGLELADGRRLLRDVSLSIAEGESLGLVGESGSGKSLTARSVIGLTPAGSRRVGEIRIDGVAIESLGRDELRRLRGDDVAMIFQNPRAHVNPVRTIEDHVTEPLRFLRAMSRRAARARALELLEAVLIGEPAVVLRRYPHELSGGMLQRVMIAGALAQEPRLLLADEPTTALDVTTQAEVVGILAQLRRSYGMAMLFITHDLELAAAICDRTAVMYAGTVVETQPSDRLERHPLHPYTSALQHARPSLTVRSERLPTIAGASRTAADDVGGCAFAERCAFAVDRCRASSPSLEPHLAGAVACFRADELRLGSAAEAEA
jgi:oligopeptide/dipeptide ABC transporter ATP-binding protein